MKYARSILAKYRLAANLGHLAAPASLGQTTLHFNPIGIDLNGDGQLATIALASGDVVAFHALSHLVGAVGYLAQQHNTADPTTPLGLVTQRLGSLSYGIDRSNLTHNNGAVNGVSYSVTATDPATGRDAGLRWDEASFRALDAPVGSAAYFQTLDEYYLANALARQAIAPVWEVQTGNLQAANGQSDAGHSANQFDTTYLIAAPTIFYWAGGVKIIEKEAVNDDFSIVAA